MTHDDFFSVAIDPETDAQPSRSAAKEIAKHRQSCAECRELELEYADVLRRTRGLDLETPELDPELGEVIALEAEGQRKKRVRRRKARRALLTTSLLACVAYVTAAYLPKRHTPIRPDSGPTVGLNDGGIDAEREIAVYREFCSQFGSNDQTLSVGEITSATVHSDATKRLAVERLLAFYVKLSVDPTRTAEERIEARLRVARSLHVLGRTDEACDELQRVLLDPTVSGTQRALANEVLERLLR